METINHWDKILNNKKSVENNINIHKDIVLYGSTEAINDVMKEEPGSLPESVDEPKPTSDGEGSDGSEDNTGSEGETTDASPDSEGVDSINGADTGDGLTESDKKLNDNVFASSNGQLKMLSYYRELIDEIKECSIAISRNEEYKGVVTLLDKLLDDIKNAYDGISISNIYDSSAGYHLFVVRFREITKNIPNYQVKESLFFKFDIC